jgi:hypothetical protein
MGMRHLPFLLIFLVSFGLAPGALAQLTSGISGPDVTEGARAIGYRAAYDPDADGFAQRVHVDQALTGALMLRGVVQVRRTDDRPMDFDFVQGELRWQVTPDNAKWASGLRLDARLRDSGRPGQVSVHWLNQIRLSDTLRTRFAVIASQQTGAGRETGTFLQTRGEVSRRIDGGIDLGGEFYNSYGTASDLLPVSEQSHLAGPFAALPLTDSLTLRTSALFGLTAGSPDATFRVFLTQAY